MGIAKEFGHNSHNRAFDQSDLDLDLMTLALKLNLDMVKMFHYATNEISMSRHSKVTACTNRHTVRKHYLFVQGRKYLSTTQTPLPVDHLRQI